MYLYKQYKFICNTGSCHLVLDDLWYSLADLLQWLVSRNRPYFCLHFYKLMSLLGRNRVLGIMFIFLVQQSSIPGPEVIINWLWCVTKTRSHVLTAVPVLYTDASTALWSAQIENRRFLHNIATGGVCPKATNTSKGLQHLTCWLGPPLGRLAQTRAE